MADASKSPLWFLGDRDAFVRRLVLAEVLGPPGGRFSARGRLPGRPAGRASGGCAVDGAFGADPLPDCPLIEHEHEPDDASDDEPDDANAIDQFSGPLAGKPAGPRRG
ncbi:MAG: hypothetical protein V2A73_03520 [Pseudomonadota bacterium]